MSWDGAYVESRSVRVRRGAVDRTVATWRADGWVPVGDPPTGRRTSLLFKRVVKPADETPLRPAPVDRRDRRRLVGAAGAVVVVVAGGVVLGVVGDDATPPAAAVVAPDDTATDTADGTSDGTATDTGVVLTIGDDLELANVVADPDRCSAAYADFADAYAGRAVQLAGRVAATAARPGDTYDLLLRTGDRGDDPVTGPAVALQGVTLADLHLDPAASRDYVSPGDEVDLTAEVDSYDAASCLLFVTPLATALR